MKPQRTFQFGNTSEIKCTSINIRQSIHNRIQLTIPRPSSIFPGPKRSDVTRPGKLQTDNATPIVPIISAACFASAATAEREKPQAAAAPATFIMQNNSWKIFNENNWKTNSINRILYNQFNSMITTSNNTNIG